MRNGPGLQAADKSIKDAEAIVQGHERRPQLIPTVPMCLIKPSEFSPL